MIEISKLDYLRQLLNVYWLRPETALWRTLDCVALRKIEFEKPILDVGCGDGILSFIRAGGQLHQDYDVFLQVSNLGKFFEKEDIYNHRLKGVTPLVSKSPLYKIDCGVDHKKALLEKAATLDFYGQTVECNANQSIPCEDSAFNTVFSNILYWLEKYPVALHEFYRVLKPGGRVVLHVPNHTFKDYSFYQTLFVRTNNPEWDWLSLLDRGRSHNIQFCRTKQEWTTDFKSAGFNVVHHNMYLSKLTLQTWDIGLRPLSPVLIEMANSLDPLKRSEIKQKWIDLMLKFVSPLCDLDSNPSSYEPGFHLFVLQKS